MDEPLMVSTRAFTAAPDGEVSLPGHAPARPTRRHLLAGGAAGGIGLAIAASGAGVGRVASAQSETETTPMTDTNAMDVDLLLDEAAIRRVVDEIDNTVDAKDWSACRAYFLDEIDVDFTSLAGGIPARMAADDLVVAWATNLYSEKPSFHMRSNHRITIDGDRAEVFSKGYALNILPRSTGSDLWEVWGAYGHTLERTPQGWKCSGMSLQVVHARGNEKVREFVPES